jgi:hypothetical protein
MVQSIQLPRQRCSAESSECSNIFLAYLPEFIERPALPELHRLAPISQKLLVHMNFVKAHLPQRNLLLMQCGPNISIERKQHRGMLLHRPVSLSNREISPHRICAARRRPHAAPWRHHRLFQPASFRSAVLPIFRRER